MPVSPAEMSDVQRLPNYARVWQEALREHSFAPQVHCVLLHNMHPHSSQVHIVTSQLYHDDMMLLIL